MSDVVIKVENLSKQYRIGRVGTGTLSHDINRLWARIRGQEDPYLKLGEVNDRTKKGSSEYVWALKNINFEIKRGEVLGIIGKNGAGKSTLLKILSQVTTPTTGSVKMKGRIGSLLEVGTGFHPELTGRENIYLNGAILGMRKLEISKKLDEIIYFAGVEKFIDTPVKRYSSGMKVRLGFAVAAHLEPEVLIIDEVLAVGDASFQSKCIRKMNEVVSDGRTIIIVSHNMTLIRNLSSSGMLLQNGEIHTSGDINLIAQKYIEINSLGRGIEKAFALDEYDRKGLGGVRVTEIKVYNQFYSTNVSSGDDVTIEVHYKVINENLLKKDFQVALSINDIYDEQLLLLANDVVNGELFKLQENMILRAIIKNFPLVSGLYNLNVFVKVGGEIEDWILNCNPFNVNEGDFYKSGRNMDRSQAKFLCNYSWSAHES